MTWEHVAWMAAIHSLAVKKPAFLGSWFVLIYDMLKDNSNKPQWVPAKAFAKHHAATPYSPPGHA